MLLTSEGMVREGGGTGVLASSSAGVELLLGLEDAVTGEDIAGRLLFVVLGIVSHCRRHIMTLAIVYINDSRF